MLTYSQRKQYKLALYLKTWASVNEEGRSYFEHYSKEALFYINKITSYYEAHGVQRSMKDIMVKSGEKVEHELRERKIYGKLTSVVMMLSLTLVISEIAIQNVKNEKVVELWTHLINWANDSLSKNYSNFVEDIEIAEKIADIVNKS